LRSGSEFGTLNVVGRDHAGLCTYVPKVPPEQVEVDGAEFVYPRFPKKVAADGSASGGLRFCFFARIPASAAAKFRELAPKLISSSPRRFDSQPRSAELWPKIYGAAMKPGGHHRSGAEKGGTGKLTKMD